MWNASAGYDEKYGGPDEVPSTAFYFQRLRMGVDFIVSPCLKLVTRFDAMERIWGGERSSMGYGGRDDDDYYYEANSAGTRAENENIAFDLVYIDYTAPIGQFKVGYQDDYVWGTVFDNWATGNPAGQIQYWKSFGPATLFVGYAKEMDNSLSAVRPYEMHTDQDYDSYRLGGIYHFSSNKVTGETGLLFMYDRDAFYRPGFDGPPHKSQIYSVAPYVKAKIGPVNIQAELEYAWGDAFKWEDNYSATDVSLSELGVFVDAFANFGMFNVGGSVAYISGDDPSTGDKIEGGYYVTGGLDWNPCLILFNNDLRYWTGAIWGHADSVANDLMYNAWFFQGRFGVKPTPQVDVNLAVSYALADKKPDPYGWGYSYPNGTYGTEIDLTGTYKITNNLSYMLGFGYLFTGDYFKGYDGNSARVQDDYILINKLTLTF